MANTVYISAGLPVAKNSGQAPASGVNTAFVSAGLPPEVLEEETPAAARNIIIGGGVI
jgi:hypothetical protein